jgi:hypothetical protein
VIDRLEAVMFCHARGPCLDLLAGNFNRIAALRADQVVVVLTGATLPVHCLAVGRS